jgi:hypothetical protein
MRVGRILWLIGLAILCAGIDLVLWIIFIRWVVSL